LASVPAAVAKAPAAPRRGGATGAAPAAPKAERGAAMWEGPSVEELLREQGLPVPSYEESAEPEPAPSPSESQEPSLRPWANAPAGEEALFTPPKGVSPFDKSVRLVLVVVLILLCLAGAVSIGYYATQASTDYQSDTYEASVEYANQAAEEAEQFARPADMRLIIEGAEILEMNIAPADNSIMEKAEYLYAATPAFTADAIISRWRLLGLRPTVRPDESGGEMITAIDGEGLLQARIKADRGGSRVVALLRRPPNAYERHWFEYPSTLPKPPEGTTFSSKGGALGPSNRGRAYTLVVPAEANQTLVYFKERLIASGWDTKPSPRQPRAGESLDPEAASYMLTRGSEAYTMTVNAMNTPQRTQTMVMFIPF